MSSRSLEFDPSAFEDLAWWVEQNRAQAVRIIRLIREVQREPFSGLGKPEPLKYELSGRPRPECEKLYVLVTAAHQGNRSSHSAR